MQAIIDFLRQRDKQQHIAGCFALTVVFFLAYCLIMLPDVALPWAVNTVLTIGIFKEVRDRAFPLIHTADVMDIVADWVGIYIAVAAVLIWRHLA